MPTVTAYLALKNRESRDYNVMELMAWVNKDNDGTHKRSYQRELTREEDKLCIKKLPEWWLSR